MRKLFIAFAVVLSVSGLLFASNTELDGLGGIPAQLTNLDQLIYFYPSQILNFDNEVVVEYDNAVTWGYTLIKMKSSALGLALVPNTGLGGGLGVTLNDVTAGIPSLNTPAYVFNAMYGMYVGKNGLGASLTYGSDLTSTELKKTAGVEDKNLSGTDTMYLKLALGASLNVGMPLDVALSVALPSYSSNPKVYTAPAATPPLALTDDDYEKLSGMNISAGARASLNSWIFDLGLAYISEHAESRNWQDTNADGTPNMNTVYTSDDSALNINLLCSNSIEANKNISMLIGSGLMFGTTGDSKDVTDDQLPAGVKIYGPDADSGITINIPVYFSAICKLNDIFSFSAGINKNLLGLSSGSAQTVDTTDGKTIEDQSNITTWDFNNPVGFSMCLSAKFGDLAFQWLLSNDLLRAGPAIINGTGYDIGSQIALVYAWK